MRVIDSTANLIKDGCKARVIWLKDSGLNARFDQIFEPIPWVVDYKKTPLLLNVVNKIRRLPIVLKLLKNLHVLQILTKDQMEESYKFAQEKIWKRCLLNIVFTWEHFYEKEKMNNECFTLIHNEHFEFLYERINDNTIGVHIRRTDNKMSIQHSPLESFVKKMTEEMELNPHANFLVCTDDEKVKDYMHEHPILNQRIFCPTGDLNRNSVDGIRQAVAELFALSKTKKIIGSYFSSFGIIAAKLGDIELYTIES